MAAMRNRKGKRGQQGEEESGVRLRRKCCGRAHSLWRNLSAYESTARLARSRRNWKNATEVTLRSKEEVRPPKRNKEMQHAARLLLSCVYAETGVVPHSHRC